MSKTSEKGVQIGLFGEPEKAPVSRGGLSSMKDLVKKYKPKEKNKFISREHQDYGYKLAAELNDIEHKSLYIRLAKIENRGILETARTFVIDSTTAKSKAKLFMWKLKQLRDEKKKE